ncbi:DNA-binding response regulator, partial [Pseudomonas umsongensis]|nr:DNA-binding response regulator [Pseudomonas umsongensis]
MNERQPLNQINHTESMVFIVDDDAPLRESLGSLLRSIGLRVELFGSVADFMQY